MSVDVEAVSTVKDVKPGQWDNVVEQSDNGLVEHSHVFTLAGEKGLEGRPQHFLVRKKGNLIGFMRGRVRSLPLGKEFLQTSEPVVTGDKKEAVQKLVDAATEHCRKNGCLYHSIVASGGRSASYNGFLKDNGYYCLLESCRHLLDLDRDIEDIRQSMSNSRRKKFGEADRSAVKIVEPSKQDMIRFYEGYRLFEQREEVGKRSRGYFEQLAGSESILLARYTEEGDIKAENLYAIDENRKRLKYVFSSVSEDYREKNALETIHAYIIKEFREDYSVYDFGSNRLDFRNGIFRFKEQYGAVADPKPVWRKEIPSVKNRFYMKVLEFFES